MTAPSTHRILYCRCANANLLPPVVRDSTLAALERSGIEFTAVSDLCGLSARGDPLLAELADAERLTVVACRSRAIRWLFEAGGAPISPETTETLEMRSMRPEAIQTALFGERVAPDDAKPENPPPADENVENWPPWFPVLDRERCVNCKQCLSFCLFGVYALDDSDHVSVVNPHGCKNNCPACARLCPEVAVIFPKLRESPLDGAEVDDEETARANVRNSVKRFLGDDPYTALAERSKRARRRLVSPENIERALAERRAHLKISDIEGKK